MHETNANDLNARDDSVAWKSRRASLTNLFFKPFLAFLCGTLLAKTSVFEFIVPWQDPTCGSPPWCINTGRY